MAYGDTELRAGNTGETPDGFDSMAAAQNWVRNTLRTALLDAQFLTVDDIVAMVADMRHSADRRTGQSMSDGLRMYRARLEAMHAYHRQRLERIEHELDRITAVEDA